jgi:hypothetical protein
LIYIITKSAKGFFKKEVKPEELWVQAYYLDVLSNL